MARKAPILITIIIFLLAPGIFAADSEDYFFKISLSQNDVLLTIAGADSSQTKGIPVVLYDETRRSRHRRQQSRRL